MPLILPNDLANGQLADGEKLQQNFATVEDYVNQEVVRRDGGVAMTGALLLPGPPTQPNQAATKAYVDSGGVVGAVTMFAGDAEPPNWMFCRGQTISRATYASLFSIIGVRFGAGDGSTTFKLPDYQGYTPIGHNAAGGTFSSGVGERFGSYHATLPYHDHTMANHQHRVAGYTDAQGLHGHAMRGTTDASGPGGFGECNIADRDNGGFAPIVNTMLEGSHAHNFATWSDPPNSNNTSAVGADANNANIQPSMSINFIIKVS